jgi:hypothetical protein
MMNLRTKTTSLVSKALFTDCQVKQTQLVYSNQDYNQNYRIYIATDSSEVLTIEFERRSFITVSTLDIYFRRKEERIQAKEFEDVMRKGSFIEEIGIDFWTCLFYFYRDISLDTLNDLLAIGVNSRVTPTRNDLPISSFEVLFQFNPPAAAAHLYFYYYFRRFTHLITDDYLLMEDLFTRNFITDPKFSLKGDYGSVGSEFYNGLFREVAADWNTKFNSPLKDEMNERRNERETN